MALKVAPVTTLQIVFASGCPECMGSPFTLRPLHLTTELVTLVLAQVTTTPFTV